MIPVRFYDSREMFAVRPIIYFL